VFRVEVNCAHWQPCAASTNSANNLCCGPTDSARPPRTATAAAARGRGGGARARGAEHLSSSLLRFPSPYPGVVPLPLLSAIPGSTFYIPGHRADELSFYSLRTVYFRSLPSLSCCRMISKNAITCNEVKGAPFLHKCRSAADLLTKRRRNSRSLSETRLIASRNSFHSL